MWMNPFSHTCLTRRAFPSHQLPLSKILSINPDLVLSSFRPAQVERSSIAVRSVSDHVSVYRLLSLKYRTEFTHIKNGEPIKVKMHGHACPARRTIYVPTDETLRMAIVIPDHTSPHNHPMPPPSKLSLDAKRTYEQCIEAAGVAGASVNKVDHGMFWTLCMI